MCFRLHCRPEMGSLSPSNIVLPAIETGGQLRKSKEVFPLGHLTGAERMYEMPILV